MPTAAQRDESAIQMLSAWIAERGLHCTLNVGMWHEAGHDKPKAWGSDARGCRASHRERNPGWTNPGFWRLS